MHATFIKIARSRAFQSTVIGLTVAGILLISLFSLMPAYSSGRSEWLAGVVRLTFFFVAVLVSSSKDVKKHTYRFLIILLASILAGYLAPLFMKIRVPDESEISYVYRQNEIWIDSSRLPELERRGAYHLFLRAENHQTQWSTTFMEFSGKYKIHHRFTPDELKLLGDSDELILQFANWETEEFTVAIPIPIKKHP